MNCWSSSLVIAEVASRTFASKPPNQSSLYIGQCTIYLVLYTLLAMGL